MNTILDRYYSLNLNSLNWEELYHLYFILIDTITEQKESLGRVDNKLYQFLSEVSMYSRQMDRIQNPHNEETEDHNKVRLFNLLKNDRKVGSLH